MSKIRVRFAPSPTGPLHIGGVRTALYNYLFAKKNNGTFIIRIEDTDQTRFVKGAQEYILDALNWCGIIPDEGPNIGGDYGPYIQSERKNIYKQYVDKLIEEDKAYYAFDTEDELTKVREQAKQMGMPNWQYNSITRTSMKNSLNLPKDEVEKRLKNKDGYVVRFKIPRNKEIRFEDNIRGWVVVNSNNLDDKVLFKSDGMPTYHLANIVDDHLMEISHVIRGEEWLPSAPLHVLLYEAFNWQRPEFAHLPLLLRPDGNGKLSKRDGDRLGFPVFPTNWTTSEGELYSGYRENGYFSEAFINMLAFLGWNPGTKQELFSLDELINSFSIDRVGKAGAKFDADKTKWYQQQYLRKKTDEELSLILSQYLTEKIEKNKLLKLCSLMKERATFVKDIIEEGSYLLSNPNEFDFNVIQKKWTTNTGDLIKEWFDKLQKIQEFNTLNIENEFKNFLENNQISIGQFLPIFRVIITGKSSGPSMFEICEFLGKEECLIRIEKNHIKISQLFAKFN